MLVTYRYSDKIDIMSPSRLKKYKNEKIKLMILKSYEESKEQKRKNEAIFKKSTESLLRKLHPFLIKKRNFPTEWPSTNIVLYDESTSVDICVYRSCEEVKTYLLEAKGLFNWKYPYFPDDLCFFKEGYCWFSTLAHENYACIFLKNSKDIEKLKEMGIKYIVNECNEEKLDFFYEDYNLFI